jgi:hypothetical protein
MSEVELVELELVVLAVLVEDVSSDAVLLTDVILFSGGGEPLWSARRQRSFQTAVTAAA